MNNGGDVMKILLAAALATLIVAPCMAKDDEDKTQSDVQTPGVTEPRVPDTMKTAPAARIQSEERASERGSQEKTVGEKDRRLDEKRDDERK
jgi:outer membrane murein-binding lipoprotein Lpp